ncbi:switch-associated protein 70-like [Palaemon carinicauda]|uniref:switch-associated protein 70-like n=1 Tax=Palaemon carinicauda TaxID=392227 RepID=UPI0035B60692
MFTNNALKAISEKYLLGGPSSEEGFQDQQHRLMELEELRLILGGGLLMRKFWAEEEKSEELESVLDQEELDRFSEETEAVISRKDPLLSSEEEQLLLPGGAGSVISNRDVQVQVEPGLISNTDVTVQTDGGTEIEDLRRKNVTMAKELANKQAVIEAHENQLVDYYQSIQELKAELKMAQEKNDVQNQMESALAKKEIVAHDELKSILLAENEVLKKSNKERSFLNKELALEKIKLEKELMEAPKDVICSLKKELQKRDLENVIKDEGMGDVERCETAAEDDKRVVVVKEEKQEGEGPTRKLLVRKPKKKKPKRDKFSWGPSLVP